MSATLEHLILCKLLSNIHSNHKVKSMYIMPSSPISRNITRNKTAAEINLYIKYPKPNILGHLRCTSLTIELSSYIDFISIVKIPYSEEDIFKFSLHDPNYESQISELLIQIAEESSA